jgi:hypothetical protein
MVGADLEAARAHAIPLRVSVPVRNGGIQPRELLAPWSRTVGALQFRTVERPVKRIVLGDPLLPVRPEGPRVSARAAARVGWLVPPLMLLAVFGALRLALGGPDLMLGLALGLLLGLGFLWVLISSLLPAKADRCCPGCGADSLERIDADSTRGHHCRACGHRDEHASAWLLAEEEGPLERTVMRERALRKRASRAAARRP